MRIVSKRKKMKEKWENIRDGGRERPFGRRGGSRGDGLGGRAEEGCCWRLMCPSLKHAWLKLWSSTCGVGTGERGEGRKVGQGTSLIRSRKASQIDLSKTMQRKGPEHKNLNYEKTWQNKTWLGLWKTWKRPHGQTWNSMGYFAKHDKTNRHDKKWSQLWRPKPSICVVCW